MSRLAWCAFVVCAACAGSREVSTLRYTSTECPDPNGCGVPLGEELTYKGPDEAHASDDDVVQAIEGAPRPSCKTVATALVSLELGTYASDKEDYQELLAKNEAGCLAAQLDAREMACLSSVTKIDHVSYCSKKLASPTPRAELVDVAACDGLVGKMSVWMKNAGQDRQLPLYLASCKNDRWPAQLATCLTTQQYYYGDIKLQCGEFAPGWLFDQIQQRVDHDAAAKAR